MKVRKRRGDGRGWQRGIALVEPLVAVAILSVALVLMLGAYSTGSISIRKTDRQITAEHLARSQMEYTKSLAYVAPPTQYQAISPLPTGYVIQTQATTVSGKDGNIEKVTITVSFQGSQITVLEGMKLNR